jgi:CRP-like cAMP-binding protein
MSHEHLLLAGLPSAVLQRLVPRLETVSLARGHALQEPGVPARHAYFVTNGLVSLLALTADGATLELASVGKGGVVGVPLILRSTTTAHQAVVQIAGAALRIRADVLTTELQENAVLRDACLRYANQSLADLVQSSVCHHFHPLAERLCRWLLNASDRVCGDALELTHENLSQVLGAHRNAIGAAAVELENANAIRCARGRIVIVNRRRLEVSACSCYAATREEFTLTSPPADPRRPLTRR